jgi:glycosyltransferase involved in cell wall biosynthesis
MRKTFLKAIYDFILGPLRLAILPDKNSERLGLTSLRQERISNILPFVRGRLLDVGCGDNFLVENYGNGIGVDVVDWGGSTVVVKDSSRLPFDSASFDTIVFAASLNHIPNRTDALREARRLLRPSGRLVITMIGPFLGRIGHFLWWYSEEKKRGMKKGEVYGLSNKQIKRVCLEAGFYLKKHLRFVYGMNNLYIFETSNDFHQPSVCLFFTYGMSLKKWDEAGILNRETELYRKLVQRGAKVAFFTYGGKEELSFQERLGGIEIIPAYGQGKFPSNRKLAFLGTFLLPLRFRRIFCGFNVLKTNQMWGSWVAILAKWLTRKKLILRCGFEHYQTLVKENWPLLERVTFYVYSFIAYHCADSVAVTSSPMAKYVSHRFFVSANKIHIMNSLIDTQLFKPSNFEDKLERVIFVGRLSKEKNLVSLIQAAKLAGVGLDLAGDGIMRKTLEDLTRRLSADVRFLGTLENSQIADLLSKYEIFILPSFYEGNPKSLLEAMSSGKAVIGTDIEGIRCIIKDGENGILCGQSASDISRAILRLKNDPGLLKSVQEGARKFATESFQSENILDREMKTYEEVILV